MRIQVHRLDFIDLENGKWLVITETDRSLIENSEIPLGYYIKMIIILTGAYVPKVEVALH